MTYTTFDPTVHTLPMITNTLLASNSHLSIDESSIVLRFGLGSEFDPSFSESDTSLSFYDGSLSLGIGAGLLLTSGNSTPPMTNTASGWGNSFWAMQFLNASGLSDVPVELENADANLRAAVDVAFPAAGDLYDITYLEFSFNVTDPEVRGVSFDVVFGSDEYPEFKDSSFVDIAGVFVNQVNYALFNQSSDQPLSILDKNLVLGNFINNDYNNENLVLPIEYDGVSSRLEVVAPVHQGTNTIKIAIADTGDTIYDSGIFISSLMGVDYQGFGLAEVVEITAGQIGPYVDVAGNQIYEMGSGKVAVAIHGGNDVVKGGNGLNTVFFDYSLANILGYSFGDQTLTLTGPSGSTELVGIERVALMDQLFALDVAPGGNTWGAYSMLNLVFNAAPSVDLLSQWTTQMDQVGSLTGLAQAMLDHYVPGGISNDDLIPYLYHNLTGVNPDAVVVDQIESMIGPGKMFQGQAELLAFASQMDLNTAEAVPMIGVVQLLNDDFFA